MLKERLLPYFSYPLRFSTTGKGKKALGGLWIVPGRGFDALQTNGLFCIRIFTRLGFFPRTFSHILSFSLSPAVHLCPPPSIGQYVRPGRSQPHANQPKYTRRDREVKKDLSYKPSCLTVTALGEIFLEGTLILRTQRWRKRVV